MLNLKKLQSDEERHHQKENLNLLPKILLSYNYQSGIFYLKRKNIQNRVDMEVEELPSEIAKNLIITKDQCVISMMVTSEETETSHTTLFIERIGAVYNSHRQPH